MSPLLVPTGDPAGVGPFVSVRAAASFAQVPIVLFGDGARLSALLSRERNVDHVSIVDVGAVSDAAVRARAPSAEGGRAQLAALDAAIDRMLAGEGSALVTAPIAKAAVELGGTSFVGHTEHLARRAGLADDAVTMMFLGPRLRVALATTHVALRSVPDAVSSARVERTIVHLADALARLGEGARIVVAALNPHAGEAGLFGREEIDVIAPAVGAARAKLSSEVRGPLGAETAFRLAASGEVDGIVAMFHDQATIASKLLDWGAAVNVTWGLPFVRTSVDHGVAYDARDPDASGMCAALSMALRLRSRGGG